MRKENPNGRKSGRRPGEKPGTRSGPNRDAREKAPEDGVAEMDGGVMLTKAEILDFSEGADS